MHHQSTLGKNKEQRHPKVNFHQYLYYSGEPRDDISHDEPAEFEAELVENSYLMRRKFRHDAQRKRSFFKSLAR